MSTTDLERDGLDPAEAARRLAADGPNALPAPRRRSLARRVVAQLVHVFALLLWAAAGLAWLGGMPQLALAIVAVVVLNAVFSFLQEARADRAAERLRALLPTQVTVRRGGHDLAVDAADVVRGDLLVLSAGDRVPADADLRTVSSLLVDTSMLTGESEPAAPGTGDVLYAGTFVVEGDGAAVVTTTGERTRLAQITRLTTAATEPVTPLTRELHRLVRIVALIAVAAGLGFYLVALALGLTAVDGFLLGIGVTVALVPEGLLPTVTLALAWGAEQMAHRQVLVRNLDAVETLGSVTHICTDKTGTLTQNQMTVVEVWTPQGTARAGAGYDPGARVDVAPGARDAVTLAARTAARCSDGHLRAQDGRWVSHGDPMEVAMDVLARRLGVDTDAERSGRPVRSRFPFDPRRRRMSVVDDDCVLVKGAPDAVLPLCGSTGDDGAAAAVAAFTDRGLRVMAVAGRPARDETPASPAQAEHDLTLYGVLGLEDPPRTDVSDALAACRRAGIAVAMVTGDHPATAAAVADQVGLRQPGDPVLTGAGLPADDDALGALLERPGVVVARVSPEQKLRIARVLRARGHVVAMTGDGVNDGPALHEADIGIAMGASGTDVAREAADLVLLDDHFASIVAGVEQGRATYVNIRRFLTYHLTDNVAELTPFVVWALSSGQFPLALGVLQILAIDLGTDTISAVALGAEPPSRRLLSGPPVGGSLFDRSVARRAFGVLGPAVAATSMLAFTVSLLVAGWRPGTTVPAATLAAASGATFLAVAFSQAANAFACRSFTEVPRRLGWWTNRLLPPAVAASLVLALVLVCVPQLARALGQAVPPVAGWAVAVAAAGVTLAVDALDKRVRRERAARPPEEATSPSPLVP
ncbi:cation-transporting P-type ATPase [Georgenia daeguensis]|uniref:Cation-transporting P-type ATPase n=1 Tax=Georgenia daeguensis TaxID=908355 RepID=A0ABP8EPJ4_9MICO